MLCVYFFLKALIKTKPHIKGNIGFRLFVKSKDLFFFTFFWFPYAAKSSRKIDKGAPKVDHIFAKSRRRVAKDAPKVDHIFTKSRRRVAKDAPKVDHIFAKSRRRVEKGAHISAKSCPKI